MIKKLWWRVKVGLFPHLERRQRDIQASIDRRQRRGSRMSEADDMLATAIMDLTDVLEGRKK